MDLDTQDLYELLAKHDLRPVSEIGRGAQGVCYVVYSQKYKMEFVAKIMKIKPGTDGIATRGQFEREVYSLVHITHKNIVKIYDYFAEGLYLVMVIEYCQRGSLHSLFTFHGYRSKPVALIPYPQLRKVIIDILSGLAYIHDTIHISHHDIKLHNILIDQYGVAKLCDFGLSQLIMSNLTNTSDLDETIPESQKSSNKSRQNVAGSIYYMSPQLLECSFYPEKRYDMFAADMWAFGITLYTLVTARYPFLGHTKKDIYDAQRTTVDFSNFNPGNRLPIFDHLPKDIPSDILYVLVKCLEFKEEARATASELLQYMEKSSESQSIREIKVSKSGSCRQKSNFPLYTGSLQREDQKMFRYRSKVLASSAVMFKRVKIVKPCSNV